MSTQPARSSRLGLVLGGALVLLLPVFFVDGFHDSFSASKVLLAFTLGLPAAVLLMWPRPGRDDTLATWRWLLLIVPLLAVVSLLKGPASAMPLVMAGVGWIALEIGAAHGEDSRLTRRCVALLGASTVPVLLVGLLRRHAGWFDFIPDRTDVALSSTIGNSLEVAEFAAPVAILSLLLPATGRAWGWSLVASSTILVALSESRGGALALLAGLVVAGLMLFRRQDARARMTGRVALGLAGVAVVAAFAVAPDRALSVVDAKQPTNAVRLGLWEGAVGTWLDSPVLGCGAGRFEAAFPPFRSTNEWDISGFGVVVEEPHQEVLWLLAEGGVLGLLALVAVLVLTFGAWRTARDAAEPARRHLSAVAAGALVAFIVTALVRAPLHHACGILPAGLVTGLVVGGGKGRSPDARARWVSILLLILGAFLVYRHVVADRHVYVARWAKVRANEELKKTNLSGMVRELTTCKEALDDLATHGPCTAAQAWRAALVGRELATLRERMSTERMRATLSALGEADPEAWLPTRDRVIGFLDATLERAPHHPLASLHRAMVALEMTDVARARALVEDEGTWRAIPWPDLLEVRGRTALRLGADAATFGSWLGDKPEPDRIDTVDRDHAAAAFDAGEFEDALRSALRHLGRNRWDAEALRLITDSAYRAFGPDTAGRALGDHAVARLRLLLARDADKEGNARMVATNLRLARRKDRDLLDAVLLAARAAIAAGDDTTAGEHRDALIDAGVPSGQIASLLR